MSMNFHITLDLHKLHVLHKNTMTRYTMILYAFTRLLTHLNKPSQPTNRYIPERSFLTLEWFFPVISWI